MKIKFAGKPLWQDVLAGYGARSKIECAPGQLAELAPAILTSPLLILAGFWKGSQVQIKSVFR